jgi:cell division protein FtsW (lipid II flippase)
MPNDVKAAVSAITLAVALILAFWSGSPIRPDFATFVVIVAVFMIVAMWVFPEAGGKKRRPKDSDLNGTKAAP